MINPHFTTATRGATVDQGLRAYMLSIYNYMALGVGLTGLVAFLVANLAIANDPAQAVAQFNGVDLTAFGQAVFVSPLKYLFIFAPLAFVMLLSFGVQRLSLGATQLSFWAFSAVMGLSLSTIFLVYSAQSISQAFFVTAASFGALSLYGYTTKRDLSAIGSFLVMGLLGLVIASLVNLFVQSSAFHFALSVIAVLIFSGLTAWDTQRLKESYHADMDSTVAGKTAVMGALSLYLDFINLFQALLALMGSRRD